MAKGLAGSGICRHAEENRKNDMRSIGYAHVST